MKRLIHRFFRPYLWTYLLFPLALQANDPVTPFYQFDLRPTLSGEQTRFEIIPRPSLVHDMVKSQYYYLHEGYLDYFLDAPFRRLANNMYKLTQTNYKAKRTRALKNSKLARLGLQIHVRQLDGKLILSREIKVRIDLKEQGRYRLSYSKGRRPFIGKLTDLGEEHGYIQFLQELIKPLEKEGIVIPEQIQSYTAELYFSWPRWNPSNGLTKGWFAPSLSPHDNHIYHLGTALVNYENSDPKATQNPFLNHFHQAVLKQTQSLNYIVEKNDPTSALPLMRTYFQTVPSDRLAAYYLSLIYELLGKTAHQTKLIANYQPFFVNMDKIWQDGAKPKPEKDDRVLLRIISPQQDDLVAGSAPYRFVLKDQGVPVSRIRATLNGRELRTPTDLPLAHSFRTRDFGQQELAITAWFQDGSWQNDKVSFEAIPVDTEGRTNLVELEAVFKSGSNTLADVSAGEVSIRENGVSMSLDRFKKGNRPLRIIILIDASLSMAGQPIRAVRHGVSNLLKNLNLNDRVAIYSFDDKVIKIKGFDDNPTHIPPQLTTLNAQMGTALNDALLTARNELMREGANLSRVLITISDGEDTGSITTSSQIASILHDEPIRVYAIQMSSFANVELSRLARKSGGSSHRIANPKRVESLLERMISEVRNLYDISYYSRIDDPSERKIELTTEEGKARWLNQNKRY